MNPFYFLGIALALALDAFTVAAGLSLRRAGLSRIQTIRLSLSFGLFQCGMSLFGFWSGRAVLGRIEAWDHWIAFGLLLFVGLKMIGEAFRPEGGDSKRESDPTKGVVLLFLSVATSIDAFAVGLGLAVLDIPILLPAVLIGSVAFVLSLVGAEFGRALGRFVGRSAPVLGGIVLILIGIKILIDHV